MELFLSYRDDQLRDLGVQLLNVAAGRSWSPSAKMFVDNDAVDVVIPLGESQTSLPIDIADAITAIGAAHVEYRFGSGYAAVLGLGVQQDVIQGEYGVSDVVAGKAELSGAFIHLGMAVDL